MKYLICLLLFATACAPQGKAADTPAPLQDPLRQLMPWQSSGPWWATNISVANTGAADFSWILAYDQQCNSHAVFGTGTMVVSASNQSSSVQFTDIQCSSFDGAWTWGADARGNLVLCQNTPSVRPCVTFN